MKQYLELVQHIFDHGEEKKDRTGTGTLSVFGYQMRFNLAEGFPLCTTKKVLFKSLVHELLWFIKGSTNIHDNLNTKIWDAWADKDGNLGRVYGAQWTDWRKPDGSPVNQIEEVIQSIKENPSSRRATCSVASRSGPCASWPP